MAVLPAPPPPPAVAPPVPWTTAVLSAPPVAEALPPPLTVAVLPSPRTATAWPPSWTVAVLLSPMAAAAKPPPLRGRWRGYRHCPPNWGQWGHPPRWPYCCFPLPLPRWDDDLWDGTFCRRCECDAWVEPPQGYAPVTVRRIADHPGDTEGSGPGVSRATVYRVLAAQTDEARFSVCARARLPPCHL